MCGRYSLGLRPSEIRNRLGWDIDSVPDDDDVRQSYNFAPGYYGIVYRADVPDRGAGDSNQQSEADAHTEAEEEDPHANADKGGAENAEDAVERTSKKSNTTYKLQAMKWGLIPFWTKRSPDYGSMLRTINCRDDSLYEDRGMWTNMKRKKRCVILCEGFYEWLKKNNGKERIPHYVKRADGKLMCFAGLWDCVKYEDSEEKLYTYTIITTSVNKQLEFLHDRMPCILDENSEGFKVWLDPDRFSWSKELQSILKPYQGKLEVYPVSKDVGKVGNNSSTFTIPVNSSENKNNIANFFSSGSSSKERVEVSETKDQEETATAVKVEKNDDGKTSIKRQFSEVEEDPESEAPSPSKTRKGGKRRSATSNAKAKSPVKTRTTPQKNNGSQKITQFFGK